ncbi:MAG: flagellar filament capping protein FliD [Actinomycetota bacterium]
MSSIDGLSSGLDTTAIIDQLMQLERQPQAALATRRDQEQAARTELSGLRSDLTSIRNQAADLRLSSGFERITATSSDPDNVSVTASTSATTGSYTFEVTTTAQAASVYSDQVYASLEDSTGAAGISTFSASGYQGAGFSAFQGNNFPDGPVTVTVTQGSEPAKVVGGIPTIPITVDGTNDGIDFEVDGFSFSVSLDHGTYNTEQALADALSAAVSGHAQASAVATVSLNASNEIELRTRNEGSDRSIIVTGGTAMTDLGFSLGQAGSGVDGLVEVDGVVTAISDTTAGTTVSLASGGAGSIEATLSGGVRTGSITAEQSTSGGSLQEVVNAINSSDNGYSALAVNTGSGYRLQLTSDETGLGASIDTGTGEFGSMTFTQLTAGQDATLTVQGDNPLTITSSSNTFNDVLPGVTVTVNGVTDGPVTVSTEQDVESITASVEELVTNVNAFLSRVASSTSNDPDGSRTVLQGDRTARRAAEAIRNAMVSPVDDNPFGSIGLVGLELTREGTLEFDASTFADALATDPDALSALFTNGSGDGELGALDRLVEAAETATSVGTGYLYTAGEAADQRIDDYGRQIDAFERRLEIRESTLRRTYANLEVALGGLQQQSSWLASQLANLGGGSLL